MTALAPVISLDEYRPRRGRPPKDDDARMDLVALHAEVRRLDAALFPLMQQAKLAARHHGSAEFRVIASIDHLVSRFIRQWAEPEPAA